MTDAADISVKFHQPPADLERFFTTFYCGEAKPAKNSLIKDALHPEWAGLRIFAGAMPDCRISDEQRLSGADCMITGPSSLPLHFQTGRTRFWGFGLLPLGWATFVGQPANQFANTIHDARTSEGFQPFADLADRIHSPGQDEAGQLALIETFFRQDAPRYGKEDPRIQTIHRVLIEPELPHVSEMAERCSLNQRTLERLCSRHFGFSPKLLLRRQRFMRSLADFMLDPTLSWIGALDSLYFDQSHFVRDCKKFLGMSPSQYAAMDHPVIAQFMRERLRVHGSAVQTLDKPD